MTVESPISPTDEQHAFAKVPVEAERDFGPIFDRLPQSYLDFGETLGSAIDRAGTRALESRAAAERIPVAPRRGGRHDGILPGLRYLAIGRAVYRFDVDEARRTVRVLATFFGGRDRVRRMPARLLEDRGRSWTR